MLGLDITKYFYYKIFCKNGHATHTHSNLELTRSFWLNLPGTHDNMRLVSVTQLHMLGAGEGTVKVSNIFSTERGSATMQK